MGYAYSANTNSKGLNDFLKISKSSKPAISSTHQKSPQEAHIKKKPSQRRGGKKVTARSLAILKTLGYPLRK